MPSTDCSTQLESTLRQPTELLGTDHDRVSSTTIPQNARVEKRGDLYSAQSLRLSAVASLSMPSQWPVIRYTARQSSKGAFLRMGE